MSKRREDFIENNIVIPAFKAQKYIFREDIKVYEDILENFWEKAAKLNNNGVPFTENEKKDIYAKMYLEKVKGNKGRVRNAFKLMYIEDGFYFDKDDGTKGYFKFIDESNINNNTFEVVHQIALENQELLSEENRKNHQNKNKADIIILINGIPRVWFELKEEGVSYYSAITQEERYHEQSMYGLMNYVTIFAVSNNSFSRYTVNDEKLNRKHYWKWKDDNNDDVDDSAEFVSSFFNQNTLIDILTNGVFVKYGKAKNIDLLSRPDLEVFNAMFSSNEEQNIILKGYQYRAYKAAYRNATYNKENSVCWLHMGTGKTLISLCLFSALKRQGYQVIFLVDRKNLNTQSKREYVSFDPCIVDSTDESKILDDILDGKSFITTLQKFNAMLSKLKETKNEEVLKKLKAKSANIQFLQDEVHRTQGKMIQAIEKYFPNSKKHGFTGTPLLTKKQLSDKTKKLTLDLFGLDKFTFEYQCINAMEDEETTKIRIEEVQTVVSSKITEEDTKEIVEVDEDSENPKMPIRLEKILKNEGRIYANCIYALKALPKKCIFNSATKKLNFSSQFIVSSVDFVNLYFNGFLKAQKDLGTNYSIFAIGEVGSEIEYTNPADYSKKIKKLAVYKPWIESFNKRFGTTYDINQYEKYEADVINRALNGEIDMIISCSKLTTGYDNPQENTIFIDRFFPSALLLQVVARATRLFVQKEFANVISFVPIKNNFDEALRLYNKTTDLYEHISWVSYTDAVKEFIESVKTLRKLASTVKEAKKISNKEKRKEFIEAFLDLYRKFRIIQSYIEYEFNEVEFCITENEINAYKGIIASWRDEAEEDAGNNSEEVLDFNFEIIDDESLREIDTDYIRRLISKIVNMKDEKEKKKEADRLIKEINASKNELIIIQKDILLRSIEEALKSKTMEEYYDKIGKVVEEMKSKEIEKFTIDNDLDLSNFKDFMFKYLFNRNKKDLIEFTNNLAKENPELKDYMANVKLKEDIKKFVLIYSRKYSMCY